jgi:alpha-glucosidase
VVRLSDLIQSRPWWNSAVTYQIYIRSFADSNCDGIGDVPGIISRIPYLKTLGVDAIWVTPWYPSPRIDNGYDVVDFMDIAAEYGDLADAKRLIEALHAAGLKLIIDIVPNHSSNQHDWFQKALKSQPGSLARNRYLFRDGKGLLGELPPNNWESIFGGPAWSRTVDADGRPEQWYCHLFAPEQPDFNWESPDVRQHFDDILRFWLEIGVDGFRIDVAHGLVKEKGLPDAPVQARLGMLESRDFPFWDQEGVHEIYRHWRQLTDSYPGNRLTVAEAWVNPPSRVARYARPGELCTVFNFDFMSCRWSATEMKDSIDRSIDGLAQVGASPTWVLNNHDAVRSVDRFDLGLIAGRGGTTRERLGNPNSLDLERGLRRARAGALLMLALPGNACIYQGEELGLPEVRDIPKDRIQDPIWRLSEFKDRGRDGCRVPLPWEASPQGGYGFSSDSNVTPKSTWLPQPDGWANLAVGVQVSQPESTFSLYQNALKLRRELSSANDVGLCWRSATDDQLFFQRSAQFASFTTFGVPASLPEGWRALLSSAQLEGDSIPADCTVWMQKA